MDAASDIEKASPPASEKAIAVEDTGFFGRMRAFEASMDRRLGIESEAIERKLPENRKPPSFRDQLTMFCLWASGTMNLSCFATGFLGADFGVNLGTTIPLIIFGSLLGASITGFCATLGAPTGLRQISIARYSMGWYPNKIIAALNTITQLGWAAVASITAGLALQAVSNGRVSIAVGIVIVAIVSFVISFIGLKAILVWERYAWLVYLVIFLVIYGEAVPQANNEWPFGKVTGRPLSGDVLTLLAIFYGSSASWCSMASDYYVHYPVDVSRVKVFLMTTLGIALPTSFGMIAGACVSSAFTTNAEWAALSEQGLGYLVQGILHPRRFADFILVVFVLSGINVNIISIYSAAISCQQFSHPFARVPRFIWTILCLAVILALGLAGRNKLETYLEDFLSILGYWSTVFFVIIFSEHMIFRKGDIANYNLEGWDDPSVIPVGLAALTAFLCGVGAFVVGMDETWYIGPLALAVTKPFGGDLANEFALCITFIVFVPLRFLEKKHIGSPKMFLTMADLSPINTVFSDESGNAVYKTSTPKMGGTTFVSAAVRDTASLGAQSASDAMASPAGETQFANLASIDFHEYHVMKSVKSVIVFRGEEKVVSEWLRKDGAGIGWYGSHRLFTGSDGREYRWLLKANHTELRTHEPNAAEQLVATFRPRKDILFFKGKQPPTLEIDDAYKAIQDEIVVTFIFLEQLRGVYDRGEVVVV
ncbi:hypothetical protein HMN09_00334300 [Mycena chlorophos]|uniref:DUF6593 domain-containing protein n=1 Tax=Mycena chlorophos TaxID=658473 RepID=A0A8H6WKN5_MYCCL|nr:hypothetical protein HMN09_00334300 [Mycena chlorophos]